MGLDGSEDGHWISFDGELILSLYAIWPRVEGCAVPAFAAIVGDTSQLFESVWRPFILNLDCFVEHGPHHRRK